MSSHPSKVGRSKKSPARKRTAPERNSSPQPLFGPRQIALLRESFAQIERQAGIAGLVFYRNLFTLDPSLRPLFHTSIDLQGRKLLESLSHTVATLENPRTLVPVLEAMGRRHVAYGARDEHYETVVQALLLTLAQILNTSFSQEVQEAWNQALSFVAKTMKDGASQSAILEEPNRATCS